MWKITRGKCNKNEEFGFRHINFDMLIRQLSVDIQQAAACKNLKLRGELRAGNTDVEVVIMQEVSQDLGLDEIMEAASVDRGEKSKEKIRLV